MNNEHTFTTPTYKKIGIALAMFLAVASSTGCDASNQSSMQEQLPISSAGIECSDHDMQSVSNAALCSAVAQVDQNLVLSESGGILYVTLDLSGHESKETIFRFFWDAAQLLAIPEMSDYSDICFSAYVGTGFKNVSIRNYKDIHNFVSGYVGLIDSGVPDAENYMPAFYSAVFGGHDHDIVYQKSLYDLAQQAGTPGYIFPDNYQNGYLWAYSNFNQYCGYSVNGDSISITVVSSDTVENGKNAAASLNAAMDSFNSFYKCDPESMPYTQIYVRYTDLNSANLWEWCSQKDGNGWRVVTNKSDCQDFSTGIKQYGK